MKTRLIIAAGILLLLGAGSAFYFFKTEAPVAPIASEDLSMEIPAAAEESDYLPPLPLLTDPQGFNRYQNAAFKFTLLYPNTLGVREYKEKDGSFSVTFEEPTGQKGFQIYVTKYASEQITRERFLLDSPSGVMNEPTDVLIDGVRGTMFFGRHSLMGETREVWFIKNGYLYEVATYKELDSWLAGIMATWKFAQ